MLCIGQQITLQGEVLQPITSDELFRQVTNPSDTIKTLIQQLRIIRTVDIKRYNRLKRSLPYVVCGNFNPAVRRRENFANIDSFIVDIDHISTKGLDLKKLKEEMERDTRVVMCFISPSQDGLKLLFELTEPCYDSGLFSLFYKAFLKKFSEQYHLEQVVDSCTCDVTRACFLSWDAEAYHNPIHDKVDLNQYVDTSNPNSLFDQKRELDQQFPVEEQKDKFEVAKDPDADAIAHIKEILALQRAKVEKKEAYVPDEVNQIMNALTEYLATMNIHIDETIDINYGKKIRMSLGIKKAECNVFYGRRGFTVVESPRSGTDSTLNELSAELLRNVLAQ